MLAFQFYARDGGEFNLSERHIADSGPPLRHGARLVEDDIAHAVQRFQRLSALEQHAALRALARAHHDGDGSREPQRARTGDDQHRNRARERVFERIAAREPAYEDGERDAHDHGHEHARDLVRHLGDGRLFRARVLHQLDDLGKDALAAHGGHAGGDVPRPADGAADELVPFRLFHGDALAADGALVHEGVPGRDNGVRGHGHARLHHHDVTRHKRLAVHLFLHAVPQHQRALGHQLAELVQRVAGAAFGEGLEIFAHRDERKDHPRRLEIKVMKIALDQRGVPRAQPVAHPEYREYAVKQGGGGSHRDERVHVGRARKQPLETVDVVRSVDVDDGQTKQDLQKGV